MDGGPGGMVSTTVINLIGDQPVILREGLGDVTPFRM